MQTLENNPALIHGGPFANIAHGCNSVIATQAALKLGDYVVTEAGFGADLGAEKFIDIKCRKAGLRPDAVVIVATLRALKYHGGVDLKDLTVPDPAAVEKGLPNLERHVENIRHRYGLPCVVALNHFTADTEPELAVLRRHMERQGVPVVVARHWAEGSAGAEELAHAVVRLAESGTSAPAIRLRGRRQPVEQDEGDCHPGLRGVRHLGRLQRCGPGLPACSKRVTATTRCAWPRRSTRFRPTPGCEAHPRATW